MAALGQPSATLYQRQQWQRHIAAVVASSDQFGDKELESSGGVKERYLAIKAPSDNGRATIRKPYECTRVSPRERPNWPNLRLLIKCSGVGAHKVGASARLRCLFPRDSLQVVRSWASLAARVVTDPRS